MKCNQDQYLVANVNVQKGKIYSAVDDSISSWEAIKLILYSILQGTKYSNEEAL